MKIAVTADLHLRGQDLDVSRQQLQRLLNASQECEGLIICGDVFDRPSIGDAHASTGAVAEVAIEAVAAFARPVLIVLGNHDYSGAGSADALHVFDGMPSVKVVREPDVTGFLGLLIGCLPWRWAGPAPNCLDLPNVVDMLVGHLRVGGARMGSVVYEERPHDFCLSRAGLDKLAKPARRVYLGDFHKRQDLTGKGGYVGALRQLNFGEEGNPEGFEIVDTDDWSAEWVDLPCSPHKTIEIRPGDPLLIPRDRGPTRVRFLGTPDPKEVRHLEGMGVAVQQIVAQSERIGRAEVPEGAIADRRELIRLWARSQSPPVDGDRLEKMLSLYGELA